MSHETLRELERALTESPTDGGARLRLAQALARAGRRREALDRLDLALVRDSWFGAAKTLSDELWQEQLARLERVHEFPTIRPFEARLDGTGEWLGWTDASGAVRVGSLASGRVVFEGRGWISCVARNRFFGGNGASESTLLECESGGVRSRTLDWKEPKHLLACSPEGARVAAQTTRDGAPVVGIYETASLEPLFEETSGVSLSSDVDWEHEILELRGAATTELRRFDGEVLETHPVPGVATRLLGRGLVSEVRQRQGVRLRSLVRGWRLPLGEPGTGRIELARDGRGVRFLTSKGPRRVDVDLDTGALLSDGGETPGKPEADGFSAFHPSTDALFVTTSKLSDPLVLRTFDGRELLRLPTAPRPLVKGCWTADGHGLVVLDLGSGRTGEARFEVWRAKDPSP